MNDELNPREKENIKKLLKDVGKYEVSPAMIQALEERLDKVPETLWVSDIIHGTLTNVRDFSSRRPVHAFAAAMAFFLAFVFIYSYAFLPQSPVLTNIKGTVKIYSSRKNVWVFAKNNQSIRKNDIVKTFHDGRTDISLGDTYSMRLKRNSEIKVARLNSKMSKRPVRFDIAKGKVFAYYNSRAGRQGKGFELKTKEILSSVVGTDFMLEAIPKLQKTWLGVLDGIVRVTSTDIPEGTSPEEATVYVKSRYRTEVSKGKVPKAPKRMMEEEWYELKELYSLGRKPQVALLISAGSSRTRELLSIAPLYISDKETGILPDKITEIAKTFSQAIEKGSKRKHIQAIREFEEILEKHPNPVYDVPFMLFIGSYYEYVGEHEKAISTFQDIIDRYPRSNLISIAQCAIGIIYEEKLRDKEAAKTAYNKLIDQYPESPEAEVALAGLKRLTR